LCRFLFSPNIDDRDRVHYGVRTDLVWGLTPFLFEEV